MTAYLTITSASLTYQTISGMSSYLTTAIASSTYQTISNMSNYQAIKLLQVQKYLMLVQIILHMEMIACFLF